MVWLMSAQNSISHMPKLMGIFHKFIHGWLDTCPWAEMAPRLNPFELTEGHFVYKYC